MNKRYLARIRILSLGIIAFLMLSCKKSAESLDKKIAAMEADSIIREKIFIDLWEKASICLDEKDSRKCCNSKPGRPHKCAVDVYTQAIGNAEQAKDLKKLREKRARIVKEK
ncbi:MAG: hypothetical protein FWE50_03335 [Alphaproteobacteria bacterium]|nr:hypothetical protein [Alphaproteobacteria bacterium]